MVGFSTLWANDQMRTWTLASGTEVEAEIVAYDEANQEVTLRRPNREEFELKNRDLSTLDRAWVLQWVEKDEEARALLAEVGGTVTEHETHGDYPTVYAVYQPEDAEAAEARPLLMLFHPGGDGRRSIYRYLEAAAKLEITLVSFESFQNTDDDPEEEAALLARFREVLPQVESAVAHDPQQVYMGGMSGGAWRAYHYAAQVDRPWAGILAAGGWLGGPKYRGLPYPSMRVAMMNGDKDVGAKQWLDDDADRLQSVGCEISVHAFEGGHQLAPPSVQEKALRWLLKRELPREDAITEDL